MQQNKQYSNIMQVKWLRKKQKLMGSFQNLGSPNVIKMFHKKYANKINLYADYFDRTAQKEAKARVLTLQLCP